MTDHSFGRRDLLGGGAAALVMAALSQRVSARTAERRLAFANPHNGERYEACYFSSGRYRADGLAELNHALRDWRTGEVRHMDPKLLDLLVKVRDRLDVSPHQHLKLVSGYRCSRTNRSRPLARRSEQEPAHVGQGDRHRYPRRGSAPFARRGTVSAGWRGRLLPARRFRPCRHRGCATLELIKRT